MRGPRVRRIERRAPSAPRRRPEMSSSGAAAAGAVVFVMRAGERFAEVPFAGTASVAGLAEASALKLGWNVPASRLLLFLVPAGQERAVQGGDESGVVGAALFPSDTLARAGVVAGAHVLARVAAPPSPAPAQGACALPRASLCVRSPVFCAQVAAATRCSWRLSRRASRRWALR